MHTLPTENKRTVQKIADQANVNPSTVQRAEKFAE
jgi:DNA-binding MurR/RpiR family transcriptional regulator